MEMARILSPTYIFTFTFIVMFMFICIYAYRHIYIYIPCVYAVKYTIPKQWD